MRAHWLAPLGVFLGLALAAAAAGASPTTLQLRVEGKSQTLFEGPISSEGRAVQASSDTQPRSCDGVNPNDPENTAPGATPTAAAADAMALIGETFDGTWYGGLNDYLINRWGPQRSAEGDSWFLLVNSVLSSVGGCQLELHEDARVLWAFAPSPAKLLSLFAPGAPPGAPPLTATATLGVPFALEVAYHGVKEGKPPPSPESAGYAPYGGADISPVTTSPQGFETAQSASPETVITNAEGKARITFHAPGWHRLKAVGGSPGVIRSNRLDVCVRAPGESGCGALPVDDQLRGALGASSAESGAGGGTKLPGAGGGGTGANPQGGSAGSLTRGLSIDGLLLFPLDARSAALHYRGPWRLVSDKHAWHDVVAIGHPGASLSVHLGRGRPMFIVRETHRKARVRITVGDRSETLTVPAGGVARLLRGPRLTRGAIVHLRVLAGTVALDGVALTA